MKAWLPEQFRTERGEEHTGGSTVTRKSFKIVVQHFAPQVLQHTGMYLKFVYSKIDLGAYSGNI
jgi:hypothetical protein